MSRTYWTLTATVALLLAPSLAHADGLALATADVPDAVRAGLAADVAAERRAHPEAFAALRGVNGYLPEGYRDRRNPVPEATRELRLLGKAALWPMVEALAFDVPAPAKAASSRERAAFIVGLLEATGDLADARTAPLLRTVHEKGPTDAHVRRAAAIAVGRVCDDASLAHLVGHTADGDPLAESAIAGLGACRRVEAAQALADLADRAGDDARRASVAQALGALGSRWAWESQGPGAAASSEAVRTVAAQALSRLLLASGPDARREASKALGRVGHRAALPILQAGRAGAAADVVVDLDRAMRVLSRRAPSP